MSLSKYQFFGNEQAKAAERAVKDAKEEALEAYRVYIEEALAVAAKEILDHVTWMEEQDYPQEYKAKEITYILDQLHNGIHYANEKMLA